MLLRARYWEPMTSGLLSRNLAVSIHWWVFFAVLNFGNDHLDEATIVETPYCLVFIPTMLTQSKVPEQHPSPSGGWPCGSLET